MIEKFLDCMNAEDHPELLPEATMIGNQFASMVDFLRDKKFPNIHIRELMDLIYNLVGSKMVPVGVVEVETVSFMAEVKHGEKTGLILIPPKFLELCKENITMQFCALVFAGSQARDFYNDEMKKGGKYSRKVIIDRAFYYEAELLLLLKDEAGFIPTDYQKGVLEKYPKGLDSMPDELKYESKPFVMGPICSLIPKEEK
jgi:hypothetical protein